MPNIDLKELTEKFKEYLKEEEEEYEDYNPSQSKNWLFYDSISGFFNDSYFCVCFRQSPKSEYIIEIYHTTDYPEEILRIIKNIEPNAKVTYTKTQSIELTE